MADIKEPLAFGEDFTPEHAQRMLALYCRTLTGLGYRAQPYPNLEEHIVVSVFQSPKFETLGHALWMCERTLEFVRQRRFAKAYRWIGMIQGILFMNGIFSLAELKDHNRFRLGGAR
jgi:hypothetical protein